MPEYSPVLSILTATFELALAGYCLRAPGRREIQRLVALILVLLAGYQIIEVLVCGDPDEPLWARAAFADVVWLPPLGALLLLRLARDPSRPARRVWRHLVVLSLAIAAFFTVWVFADPRFVTGSVCKAVIALYLHPTNALEVYGAYYHVGLWVMMFGGIRLALVARDPIDRAHAADVAMGTVAFVVLALTTEVVFPGARNATPSIMCHYALALALFFLRLTRREARYGAHRSRFTLAPDARHPGDNPLSEGR
ncbi:MAG: hypothetical protein IT385_15120 [Deltaproteobacteria bacterium]|nr:hypothetical protein [Deltaproteobacteria bacterium]